MDHVTLIFDRRLSCFVKDAKRPVTLPCDGRATVKHLIEAAGPPHTEVGAIRAAGRNVGFDHVPATGQVLAVAAMDPPLDVRMASLLRPRPLADLRFAADVNVGKLALLLRMAGLDTAYDPRWQDKELVTVAAEQGRVVLTKDRALLKRRQVVFGRYVRAVRPDDQLHEVLAFFGVARSPAAFCRCLRCNFLLVPVAKAAIDHRLEPKTRLYFDRFKICPACQRIYWQGSHHERMTARLHQAGIGSMDGHRKP